MSEFEGKKLLILGGIKLSCDIVSVAKRLGAYVVVLDYYEDSPAKQIADEGVLIDATDVDAIVEYCVANDIDGVTTGFVDILMPICYEVCKRLNIPYYATSKMISMSTDKNVFKETCMEYNLPVPKTFFVGEQIPDELYECLQYPVFVKPLDASGSRGAGVCYNKLEVKNLFDEAIGYSSSNQAIIEEYITGREFLLNYFGQDGEFRLLSMFDRYMSSDRGSAVNYSNISLAPSVAIDYYLKQINSRVINMFKQLGFSDGIVFLQGYFDGKKIVFYEMGCRLGGSYYFLEDDCVRLNAVEMIVRYALSGKMIKDITDVPNDVAVYKKYAAAINFLLTGNDETIDKIVGLNDITNFDSFVALIKHKDIGDHYKKDNTIDKPIINVFLSSDEKDVLIKDIEALNKSFDVYNEFGQSLLMKKFNPDELNFRRIK